MVFFVATGIIKHLDSRFVILLRKLCRRMQRSRILSTFLLSITIRPRRVHDMAYSRHYQSVTKHQNHVDNTTPIRMANGLIVFYHGSSETTIWCFIYIYIYVCLQILAS